MSTSPRDVVLDKRVIVCAGSGGVGKTTSATAIALAAARSGRRVLALTVDPSKRLAQTLGVDRNLPEPVSVPPERQRQAGIQAPACLDAWMLDPGVVADNFVHRFAESREEASKLTRNRIYKQVSRMVAGMQEYMAMEALATFMREDRYDLIVLDTPPSRHALDFLYGPSRLSAFLDGRIFSLFMPGDRTSLIRRAASRMVNGVNSAVFGAENYAELQDFFSSFSSILLRMNRSASAGLEQLRDPATVAFVLVTSPASDSLTDAYFFRRKALELDLPFRGFVLNRSQAGVDTRTMPGPDLFGPAPTPVQRSALAKLRELAEIEQAAVVRHARLLEQLANEAGDSGFALALPMISRGAEDMEALIELGEIFVPAEAGAAS